MPKKKSKPKSAKSISQNKLENENANKDLLDRQKESYEKVLRMVEWIQRNMREARRTGKFAEH
jgi:hypothetical protein